MLSEIVTKTLETAPDIAVSVVAETEAVASAVGADVAVLAAPAAGLPQIGQELLTNNPRLRVVAIRSDGRATSLYELRPFERKLGEISPASLLDAVRQAGLAWA